jgi:hypothetical protein
VSNVLKPLRTLFTAIGGALPTANPLHRGAFAIKRAASTEDEVHIGLRDSSSVMQWRRMLTKTYADTLYGVPLTVKEGGVTTDATVGTLDFDASDFTLTESPEDTVAVALAYGTSAGTPAEGNHTHTAYVEVAGDTMTGALTIDVDNDNALLISSDAGAYVQVDTNGVETIIMRGFSLSVRDDSDNVTALINQSTGDHRTFFGGSFTAYSDSGSTQKFDVDGATGNIVTAGSIEIDGDLNHDGTAVGFFGVAPAARPTTYSVTNLVTDRSYDANATTTAELADVLGTLIADLRTMGLVT